MVEITAGKPSVGQIAVLATAALSSVVAVRYFSARKASAAERLTEGVLETTRLQTAAGHLPETTHLALAECAGYLLNVALRAAPGVGIARGDDDPIGFSRTQTQSFTGTTAIVRTETAAPDRTINYAVTIPEVGEVRGGNILLERNVVAAIAGLPFAVLGVMVNAQSFTKTANCWGVGNNAGGTNTNRIVLARRLA